MLRAPWGRSRGQTGAPDGTGSARPLPHKNGQNDDVGRGIGFSVLAIFLFATQDAVAKLLVQDFSPFQITMMRFWAFFALSVFMVSRQGPLREAFKSRTPWLQLLRPVLLVVDIWCFAFALQYVPLAELQAISLIYPFLVTLAAIPLLGEKVGMFRIAAVLVGLFGALVIVRPGGLPLDWGVGFAIASAATYALYIVLTRIVSRHDSTATSMVYVGVIGMLMTSAVGVFFWVTPDLNALLLMIYIMCTSCIAHSLIMASLALAPASVLQPFNYTSLPWSIALGYLVFGQLIDPVALLGALVIVGAGLVVIARERARGRAAASPPLPGKD